MHKKKRGLGLEPRQKTGVCSWIWFSKKTHMQEKKGTVLNNTKGKKGLRPLLVVLYQSDTSDFKRHCFKQHNTLSKGNKRHVLNNTTHSQKAKKRLIYIKTPNTTCPHRKNAKKAKHDVAPHRTKAKKRQ